jgi:hypothetical protein
VGFVSSKRLALTPFPIAAASAPNVVLEGNQTGDSREE